MRVAVLGLGLIGGSIARALAAEGSAWRVVAWSPTGIGPAAAAADGTAEAAETLPDAIDGADLIVLAAPPLACLKLIDRLADLIRDSGSAAVVTDVASTKRAIVERARGRGLRFVGGHPMAGRELSGYAAADSGIFTGRPWVVVPADPGDREARARVEGLAKACGARVVEMTADEHDDAVAAISHLPLVLSAALVEAVAGGADWAAIGPLAAGGWKSMTRLATGDVEMGSGILVTNPGPIAARLRALQAVIDGWLQDLDGRDGSGEPDIERIRARLTGARDVIEGEPADVSDETAGRTDAPIRP